MPVPVPAPKGPWLGVYLDADVLGVVVRKVVPLGPAETCGIKAGDRIVSLAGVELNGIDGLRAQLGKHKIGDTVKVAVERGKESHTFNLKLGDSANLIR